MILTQNYRMLLTVFFCCGTTGLMIHDFPSTLKKEAVFNAKRQRWAEDLENYFLHRKLTSNLILTISHFMAYPILSG